MSNLATNETTSPTSNMSRSDLLLKLQERDEQLKKMREEMESKTKSDHYNLLNSCYKNAQLLKQYKDCIVFQTCKKCFDGTGCNSKTKLEIIIHKHVSPNNYVCFDINIIISTFFKNNDIEGEFNDNIFKWDKKDYDILNNKLVCVVTNFKSTYTYLRYKRLENEQNLRVYATILDSSDKKYCLTKENKNYNIVKTYTILYFEREIRDTPLDCYTFGKLLIYKNNNNTGILLQEFSKHKSSSLIRQVKRIYLAPTKINRFTNISDVIKNHNDIYISKDNSKETPFTIGTNLIDNLSNEQLYATDENNNQIPLDDLKIATDIMNGAKLKNTKKSHY
jgi:hypothetical protein